MEITKKKIENKKGAAEISVTPSDQEDIKH
jgi:hypothetical protein